VVFIIGAAIGAAVAVLVILEYLGVPGVLRTLRIFRPGSTFVGAQVRAAGPFQYPTIASMYLEILFAFASALLLVAIDAGEYRGALLVGLALVVIGEAITLTLTRSGLITAAASLITISALRCRNRAGPIDTGIKALAAVACAIAVSSPARSFELLRLRLDRRRRLVYGGLRCRGVAFDRRHDHRAGHGDEHRHNDVGAEARSRFTSRITGCSQTGHGGQLGGTPRTSPLPWVRGRACRWLT
jgi:hypothetical protein